MGTLIQAFPDGGGSSGGGGHTILDSAGTEMTQRDNLQFIDSQVTDDDDDDITKIEVVKQVAGESALASLGDGLYVGTDDDEPEEVLTSDMVMYDETHTVGDAIDDMDDAKADKVESATADNLAGLDATGNIKDAGWSSLKTTTAVSGNPISISGLKSNQLAVDPVITFEPIQAGSGTPSPSNVRAISGYDKVEVLSCGKNLCEETIINASIGTDGTITTSGETGFDMHVAKVLQGVTYTIRSDEEQSVSQQFVGGFFYSKPALNSVSYNGTRLANTPATFTSPITGYVAFRTSRGYAVAQCEYGSSQTTYEPYHKTTDLSESLGQTVYGGSLDLRSGKFMVNRAIVTFTGSSDERWNLYSKYRGFDIGITGMKSGSWLDGESNMFVTLSSHSGLGIRFGADNTRIYIEEVTSNISGVTDVATWKTYLSTHNLQVAYPIEPFTIQLTPHEISLLKDYAYVNTNGTNMSFSYHNGENASLADVSQLGETVNKLGDTLPLKSRSVFLSTSQIGSTFYPTALMVGSISNLFGKDIKQSNIVSATIYQAPLTPASLLFFGYYNENIYIAASQECTLDYGFYVTVLYIDK